MKNDITYDLIGALEETIKLVEASFDILDNDSISGLYIDPWGALKDAKTVFEIARKRFPEPVE